MPDTGAPWEIPYLDGTELVRAYPAFSEDLAEQIADGLDAAGGLVAVKHALKTDAEAFTNVAPGGNVAVTGLSIAHEVAHEDNRLIITAYFGSAGSDVVTGIPSIGIAVAEDDTLLAIGDAGLGVRVGAGGLYTSTGFFSEESNVAAMPSVTFVHTPGTGEKTYTVRAVNTFDFVGQTLYVNRPHDIISLGNPPRTVSALVIQEVSV